MADSFYAPPKAAVDDAAPAGPAPERPAPVERAVKVLWVFLGFNALVAGLHFIWPPAKFVSMAYLIFGGLFGLLFSWWLYSSVAKGRNWARILYLVLTGFSVLYLPMGAYAYKMGMQTPLDLGAGIVSTCTHLYVGYLLLTQSARAWFRAMKGR